MQRGYIGIGIYQPKTIQNVGMLWRHAQLFGAQFIFTIGQRYAKEPTNTLKTDKHIPLFHFDDWQDFLDHVPQKAEVVCVEMAEDAETLPDFDHPDRAVYVLGPEDYGFPDHMLEGQTVVHIPTQEPQSLNVGTAGALVLYDRSVKEAQRDA